MMFNRALFMHLPFGDEFPLSWPEDTKAEVFFFIGSPGAYKSHW